MENNFYNKFPITQESAYCQEIAHQAIKITKLEKEIAAYRENSKKIIMNIREIGAPLNDNKLKYSHEQMKIFFRIEELLNECE